jgi:predicted nucleic acid-binding protein
MKSAVLADSGPLYAAVDPDDAYHPQAQRELKRLARNHQDVIIAYPTLLEAYTLVLHRLGRRNAGNWLENILAGKAMGDRRTVTLVFKMIRDNFPRLRSR